MGASEDEAIADALDELGSSIGRLRKQHARLLEEKPYLLRDLEAVRAGLAEVSAGVDGLSSAPGQVRPRTLSDLASRVLALEARILKMESTGLPRRQP